MMLSDQLTRMPLVACELLRICNVQVPPASKPIRVDSLPVG